MVGLIDRGVSPLEASALSRLAPMGIRAVVPEGFDVHTLRRALGRHGLQAGELSAWLAARLAELSPSTSTTAVAPRLARLLVVGSVDEAAREESRKALSRPLPTLYKWIMLGKVLPALVRLQGDPSMTQEAAAAATPYHDASDFGRACDTLFGMRPSEIRKRIGWEWLVERFLERKER